MALSRGRQKQCEKHSRDVPVNIHSSVSEPCQCSPRERERTRGRVCESGVVRTNMELDVTTPSPVPDTEQALEPVMFIER